MIRAFFLTALSLAVAACGTVSSSGVTSYVSGARPANYRCSNDVDLTIRREGSGVAVTDSRGIAASVPASPPGQNTRFSEGIYALILEGRNATWFVSGQTPVECRR